MGFPLYQKLKTKYDVVGVDNFSRAQWVENVTGKYHLETCDCVNADLSKKDIVDELLKIHKPDVIIHLASQPSMPYADMSWERALFTQINNISMNLNLLWGIHENKLNTKYIITSTTGVPGTMYHQVPEERTLNTAGSFYHITRGFDSDNCNLAYRKWGQNIVEFRTAIVYGLHTKECAITRFDTDFYFGTALNRFIKQAKEGQPITIYGKGEQRKPFISLEDVCQSLFNAVEYVFPEGHTILNQATEYPSINELANMVSPNVTHIPNPRKENEEFNMVFDNSKFLDVLGRPPQLMKDEIPKMVEQVKCLN
jgi:nucleoside-diphosphate-sugar epimerase